MDWHWRGWRQFGLELDQTIGLVVAAFILFFFFKMTWLHASLMIEDWQARIQGRIPWRDHVLRLILYSLVTIFWMVMLLTPAVLTAMGLMRW